MSDLDLDKWLAEHLFGFEQNAAGFWFKRGDPGRMLPRVSSTGNGMLLVLDALKAKLDQEDIHIEHLNYTGWRISTCREEDGWHGWTGDESLPRAVALAAKAALEASLPVADDANGLVERSRAADAGDQDRDDRKVTADA